MSNIFYRLFTLLCVITSSTVTADSCEVQHSQIYGSKLNTFDSVHRVFLKKDTYYDNVAVITPSSNSLFGIKREIDIDSDKQLLVVRALLKGDRLIAGSLPHQKGRLIASVKFNDGSRIKAESRLSVSGVWGHLDVVLDVYKKRSTLDLSVVNNAIFGDLNVKSLTVYSCSASGLMSMDYSGDDQDIFRDIKKVSDLSYLVNHGPWYPLKKFVFGFNVGATHGVNLRDELRKVENDGIRSQLFRYPGGIWANFYKWEHDGFDPHDLEYFPGLNSKGRYKLYSRFSKGSSNLGSNYFFRHVADSGLPISLVLNLVTSDSVDDQVKFVSSVLSKHVKVASIELGNELYFEDQRGKNSLDLKKLHKKMSMLAGSLKTGFPNIPIGVPIDHKGVSWNHELLKSDISFDAIVLHPYINLGGLGGLLNDLQMIDYASIKFPEQLSSFENLFPGKRIWITEWNFQDRPFSRLSNSPSGILYSANMFISMLRSESVDMAMFFSLFAPRLGIYFPCDSGDSCNNFKNKSVFEFWRSVSSLFARMTDTSVMKLSYKQGGEKYSEKAVRVQAFKGTSSRVYLAINNSPSVATIRIGKYIKYSADIWGYGNIAQYEENFAEFYQTKNLFVDDSLFVPPLSVALFEFADSN